MSEFKSLLTKSGFLFFHASSINFKLHAFLEEALLEDGKPVLINHENKVSVNFDTPITSTDDLFASEFVVAHALLESWCLSVTSDLVNELNKYVEENLISIEVQGRLGDACLVFEGVNDYIEEVRGLDFAKVSKINDCLVDWIETVDFIHDGSELYDTIAQIYQNKLND